MRKLLFPFSILYWIGISIKNFLYKKGWLRSFEFDFPIICVGNLSTGGTGKTPHVEYLIRLLKDKYKIATLSRGYGRKLKGYALATSESLTEDIGDEPKQFKQTFPDIEVCVDEDRVRAVYQVLQDEPEIRTIIMDDGLQHRRITPGLKIMLSNFNELFFNDLLLPAGNLREPAKEYQRMDIIIITKCPAELAISSAVKIQEKIKLLGNQQLYFTSEKYTPFKPLFNNQQKKEISSADEILFLSGIANTTSAIHFLKQLNMKVEKLSFKDHHNYTNSDIELISKKAKGKQLITTMKDAVKLLEFEEKILQKNLSLFILSVSAEFLFGQAESFNKAVLDYIEQAMPEFSQESSLE